MEAKQVASDHVKLAKFIARLFKRSNREQDGDDIESDALFGLALAADAYDPKRGASFETYARYRIKGAIVDGIRTRRWGGRTKTDRELAVINLKYEMKQHEFTAEEPELDKFTLVSSIESLTGREQIILRMYYWNEMPMKEIAMTLGVTEGRVSQMHKILLGKLRHAYDC